MSNAEIVVVGAGVAGLSAALAVADAGQDVTLVTKADLVESNTYHAQGGIAAAVFADDDPKLHAADTMAAGHGLCEPRAVEILTREGADRVRQFAAAGVHLLAALGCDTLAFGAETPDAAALLDTARLLDGEELNARIRQNLATGMTYAAARAAAADALHPGTGGLLRTPNNILGIEYCKAILHRHAALTPLALPRLGAAHGGGAGAHAGTPMASASFLRGLPQPDWEPFVPARAAELYGRAAADGLLLDGARLETAVLALLRMQDPANFAQVRGVSEGLENRLTAAVREADSLDDLYTRLKTKRYPHARLRRLVLDAALGFPAELPMPPYLHVLGARKAALPR